MKPIILGNTPWGNWTNTEAVIWVYNAQQEECPVIERDNFKHGKMTISLLQPETRMKSVYDKRGRFVLREAGTDLLTRVMKGY